MSDAGKLPTSSDAQNIGARADKCFMALSPETWLPKNVGGTDDFGIDYQVQTLANSQVADMFRVQLKGTTVPSLNAEETHFSIKLKASTIRYYARFTEPILLVLCDLSASAVAIECPMYHVWIHDELRRINAQDLPDDQLLVSLHVPAANVLNSATDLSRDLAHSRALANIGASLNTALEKQNPTLDAEARAAIVEKVPDGFIARGAALMESLAADVVTVWPDRPMGSMAWLLGEAERHLGAGGIEKAREMLVAAEGKLGEAAPIEVAEYWHLNGRKHSLEFEPDAACASYEKAMAAQPNLPKYAAAWAEARL